MCNIVVGYKEDFDITILEAIQYENSDGFGVAWIGDDRKLEVTKSLDFNIVEVYNEMPDDRKIFMHFRWATHGKVDERNCHPFTMTVDGREYAIMHNGIISIRRHRMEMSDTWHFVHNKVKIWIKQFGLTDKTIKLIERNLGYDRMILLDPASDTFYRFGEWKEDSKVLYSSGLPSKVRYYSIADLERDMREEEDKELEARYYSFGYDWRSGYWTRNRSETMYLNQKEREEMEAHSNRWKDYKSSKDEEGVWQD